MPDMFLKLCFVTSTLIEMGTGLMGVEVRVGVFTIVAVGLMVGVGVCVGVGVDVGAGVCVGVVVGQILDIGSGASAEPPT